MLIAGPAAAPTNGATNRAATRFEMLAPAGPALLMPSLSQRLIETGTAAERLPHMELPSEMQIKLRIGAALGDQLTPIACAIKQNITTSVQLIDKLPSAAIEALLEHSRERHRNDQPRTELDKAYKAVRAALLNYGEIALLEAQQRERRLFAGLTGKD
jgi:hypothetical protein